MQIHGELYSVATSQQVMDALVHFTQHRPDDYFMLEIVQYGGSSEELHPPVPIMFDDEGQCTTLADRSAVLHCLSDRGRLVSLVIPPPEQREITPARVLMEAD